MLIKTFKTNSAEETAHIGKEFAAQLKVGDVVCLKGELGAGKTELIKGICEYFKVQDLVTSPTFSIINRYETGIDGEIEYVYHLDLYRIDKLEDLDEIGIHECISDSNSIKLIEWPERATESILRNTYSIEITLNPSSENERLIEVYESVETYN